jgi:protocadherin Fat 4
MRKLANIFLIFFGFVAGDNGRIVYSIGSGDDDKDFSIAQNGTVYTTRLLDRETKSLYNLVVMATDQAKAPQQCLSSTVQVGIATGYCP